ncbi:MAG TPA: plastocyanin/azurin family copper-binding protein [Solirubrobacterales bacterium]|nr:plastocyanin/azurin family copper-binding protein [Solirubrobacterales bacterium]
MVHRRLARVAALILCLAGLLWPAAALATNTRVGISNYEWTIKEVHINLGEKVTWEWLGPDLMHSVTGVSPNAVQWDSDAGKSVPMHEAGDEYTIQFNEPGEYLFECKMHSFVRGKVIVSDVPGDPNSNPGPPLPLRIDLTPPTVGEVKLHKTKLSGTKGTQMEASISEGGSFEAEYYRLNSKGRRVYNGYQEWDTYVGINRFRLAARWKHFKARPGRYVAVLRATDESNNTSKPVTKSFTILGPPPPPTRRPGMEP